MEPQTPETESPKVPLPNYPRETIHSIQDWIAYQQKIGGNAFGLGAVDTQELMHASELILSQMGLSYTPGNVIDLAWLLNQRCVLTYNLHQQLDETSKRAAQQQVKDMLIEKIFQGFQEFLVSFAGKQATGPSCPQGTCTEPTPPSEPSTPAAPTPTPAP